MTDSSRHPVEPWALVEEGVDIDRLAQAESLFALSNGHIGLRGNLDEGEPAGLSGTYLNGFYESFPLEYGERGYGFAEDGQSVVNVTDGKIIRLQVEDEPLDVHRGEVLHHERRLDFRSGLLERQLHWRAASGHEVKLTTRRLVSFSLRSLAAIEYEVEAVDQPIRIAIQSNLQANKVDAAQAEDPRQGKALPDVLRSLLSVDHGMRVVLGHETKRSGLVMASGMEHVLEHDGEVSTLTQSEPDLGRVTLSAELEPGRPLRLFKLMAYHWSSQQSVDWLRDQVDASLESGLAEGFEGLAEAQREALDRYWQRADVEVEGDDGAAAGAALRDVPHLPGGRPQRGPRDSGQGAHRQRLRRPRVLGHRELRAARCSPSPRRTRCAARSSGATPRSTRRASAPASSACAGRRCPGARSAARSARATGRRAPRPST